MCTCICTKCNIYNLYICINTKESKNGQEATIMILLDSLINAKVKGRDAYNNYHRFDLGWVTLG